MAWLVHGNINVQPILSALCNESKKCVVISDAEFDRWGEAAERGDYGGSKLGVSLKTNGFISPLIVARGCPSSNPNRHKEIQWQKCLFTASHGARMLRESNPQITTVDQHMEMRGKVMADIVIKKIHGIDSPRTVMLPTELVVRQSA